MNFMVADLSSVFETQETVMDGLNRLLTSPPRRKLRDSVMGSS